MSDGIMAIFLVINIPLNQSRKSSQLGEQSRTRWGNLPFIYVDAIFLIYSIIWAKIWKKNCNCVQNLAQNWADWYMNGLLFLEKLVFVWVYFQIPWRHIPTKTKLEYPPWIWTWKSTKRWSPVTSIKILLITNLYSTSYRYRLETWNLC